MIRKSPALIFKNETRGVVIADTVRKADNYFLRLMGLLPKKQLSPGEGLWLIPCREIHSIGMRFVFDALFLDADLKVVHVIEQMKPLRVSPRIKAARTVLEVGPGVIAATGTCVGDQLSYLENR